MLTAYYDLALCPPTYDFVSFMLHVESERKKRGQSQCRVVFLPGPIGGFRRDRLWPFSIAERESLMQMVVEPMCGLLPSCIGYSNGDRGGAVDGSIGYGERLYGLAVFIEALRQTGPTLNCSTKRHDPRLVTITLRECEHWPERNSNTAEWIDAAKAIECCGYEVRFVRDTLKWNEEIPGFRCDRFASNVLIDRASLYASAFCNLFVSSGPAWFAIALGVPCLIFRPVNDQSSNPAARSSHFFASGIDRGGQVPGALATQRLVWSSDDRQEIVSAFERYRAEHAAG